SPAAPPAASDASSPIVAIAEPRRLGPPASIAVAAGAPSTRRAAVEASGSRLPIRGACAPPTGVSPGGSKPCDHDGPIADPSSIRKAIAADEFSEGTGWVIDGPPRCGEDPWAPSQHPSQPHGEARSRATASRNVVAVFPFP